MTEDQRTRRRDLDPDIARRRAAAVAGHLGDTATARGLLHDPDPDVRATALGALHRAGALERDELLDALGDDAPAVLIAEDNPANQKLMSWLLERQGYRVSLAEDGAQAVQMFGERPYRAVLMDVQMPVMSGLEATRLIREMELARGGGRTPVIAVTANAILGDRDECLAAGMDDYLAKPFTAAQLREKVEAWVPAAP